MKFQTTEQIYKKYKIKKFDNDGILLKIFNNNFHLSEFKTHSPFSKKGCQAPFPTENELDLENINVLHALGTYHHSLNQEKTAVFCYDYAIHKGSKQSLIPLAEIYIKNREYKVAEELLLKDENNPQHIYLLGDIYFNIYHHGKKGIKYYKKGHDLGNLKCTYMLGNIYFSSEHYNLSKYFYTYGANNNHLRCIESLGNYYLGDKNKKLAVKYYNKAMEKGSTLAIRKLKECYKYDITKKDNLDKIHQYRLSTKSNDYVKSLQMKYYLKWFDYMANPYTERGKRYVKRKYDEMFT